MNPSQPPSYFANLYKSYDLKGGHIIKLGPNNDDAAIQALNVWPHQFQLGGGIHLENAMYWLEEQVAGKVIVTSYLFPNATFDMDRLRRLSECVGTERLVVDLRYFSMNNSFQLP